MKQVTVAKHPETGNIITPGKNPEWGSIRVDAETVSMENGILNKSKRSAFIRGKIADLTDMNFKEGQKLTGIIQKQEQYNPFYEGQAPKINPTTGEVVLKDGRETYLQYVYTSDVNAPTDVFINEVVEETVASGQEI